MALEIFKQYLFLLGIYTQYVRSGAANLPSTYLPTSSGAYISILQTAPIYAQPGQIATNSAPLIPAFE